MSKSGCKLTHIHSSLNAINSFEQKEAELKALERNMKQTDDLARRFAAVKDQVSSGLVKMRLHLLQMALLVPSKEIL